MGTWHYLIWNETTSSSSLVRSIQTDSLFQGSEFSSITYYLILLTGNARIEPGTFWVPSRCSTTEPWPLFWSCCRPSHGKHAWPHWAKGVRLQCTIGAQEKQSQLRENREYTHEDRISIKNCQRLSISNGKELVREIKTVEGTETY